MDIVNTASPLVAVGIPSMSPVTPQTAAQYPPVTEAIVTLGYD